MKLSNPDAEWRSEGRWFVVQKGLNVQVQKRAEDQR
jgi:hypothetical protein